MINVISVGQCPPDHAAIKNLIEANFDSKVIRIDSTQEAIQELEKTNCSLVLVNRKLDIDYTDGTILIEEMQKNANTKKIPVMLISNFPEYQLEAVKLGGVKGFGKDDIGSGNAVNILSGYLPKKS